MLEGGPWWHVSGLRRQQAGCNFSWYFKDPAGKNFSEYFSDMDCMPEGEIWRPEILEGAKAPFNRGQPPSPPFFHPKIWQVS
jgi:hypothetical protein